MEALITIAGVALLIGLVVGVFKFGEFWGEEKAYQEIFRNK